MFIHVSDLIQTFQSDSLDSSTESSEVIYKSSSKDLHVSCHPSFTSVIHQLSRLSVMHFILGFKSLLPTFAVAIYDNCRPPSYHSILCIFIFSPFLLKCALLEMLLLCLVYIPLLAIYTARGVQPKIKYNCFLRF